MGKFDAMMSDRKSKVQSVHSIGKKTKRVIEPDFHDSTVVWINMFFKMDIQLTAQLEQGYPVILLFLLDAIYPNKVPWRKVDWDLQYQRALLKNFEILETVWADVNMDKARGFRVGDTALRVEMLPEYNMKEKCEFLRMMKRWFDSRVQNISSFNPIARREEITAACHQFGFKVKYPMWITMELDKAEKRKYMLRKSTMNTGRYNRMPEFKRLIWFLGSLDHQGM